jgi:hypothetical protein
MSRYIIRKMHLAHCKRGPSRCEKCREMDTERICLLDICPPDEGMMQRRVIQVEREGKTGWREFDIVKVFENQEEAEEYAAEKGIKDVEY